MTDLEELAARYDVRPDQVREVPGGVANRTYLLGDELFLRIPRTPDFERDLLKEVAVIPAARAAGVRTPAIVDFDTFQGTPYMVLERVHGTDLVDAPPAPPAVWQELGSELATTAPGPATTCRRRGRQTAVETPAQPSTSWQPRATWTPVLRTGSSAWFDRLEAHLPKDQPQVLLHGDVGVQNLTDPRRPPGALIDWGDAAWGPPGMEFAKLRLEDVTATLPSYGGPEGIEAAALWFHLSWGVSGIPKPPRPNERHWTAPPTSRLLGVLRFFAAGPPEPWSELA